MRLCDDGTSVDDWGEPSPRVSFLALPRTHTLGQFLSFAKRGFPAAHLARPASSATGHDFFALFDDCAFSARTDDEARTAIFREAAQRFGFAPADLDFIDDVVHNVAVASARLARPALHEHRLVRGGAARRGLSPDLARRQTRAFEGELM
jgi:hypothetical protein